MVQLFFVFFCFFFLFQNKCRKLLCPVLQAPDFGRCTNLAIQTNLLVLKVTYRLDILWNETNATIYELNRLGSVLYLQLQKNIGLLEAKCGLQSAVIRMSSKKMNPYFKVFLYYYTQKKCQGETIIRKLSSAVGKEIIVRLNKNEFITFSVAIIQNDNDDNTVVIFHTSSQKVVKAPALNFNDVIRCPMIILNNVDYFRLMNHATNNVENQAINSLFNLGRIGNVTTTNDTRITVCFDDYLSIFPSVSKGLVVSKNIFWLPITFSMVFIGLFAV